MGSIPGLGRCSATCLENSMNREARRATVHWVAESQTQVWCYVYILVLTYMHVTLYICVCVSVCVCECECVFAVLCLCCVCLALCNPVDYSMLGFPVLHCLPEFAQFLTPPVISSSSHPLHCLLPSNIQHARCQLASWNTPAMAPPLPPFLVGLS